MDTSNPMLAIVPCGKAKIWDREPDRGPTMAQDVYTGTPFRLNREYAKQFGDAWIILSAKYGLVRPTALIPGPYEVTFKQRDTVPVAIDRLREQIGELGLDQFPVIVGLGGKEYRAAIEDAFAGLPLRLEFPFSGLPIGLMNQATKRAILSGNPGFRR